MEEVSWDWADILCGVTPSQGELRFLNKDKTMEASVFQLQNPLCVCSILKEGREAGGYLRNGC